MPLEPATEPRSDDSVRPVPEAFRLRSRSAQFLKRLLDLSLAIPVVTLFLPPLCLLVKLGQWLQSSGPLMYRQTRCGRDGREFNIFKFRTMDVPAAGKPDIEENPGARIYPIGTVLRRSKLDEIPQFLNVLMGSMSVVGPRPHHFDDCEKFKEKVGEYALRSVAKPGITGLAQYTEYRGDFEWNCVQSRVANDLRYIRNWSLWLDVELIFRTASIVLQRIISGILRRLSRTAKPGVQTAEQNLAVFVPKNAAPNRIAAVDTPTERRAA
ncbi:MAG: sugar transferase [Fuerstiella sp.]